MSELGFTELIRLKDGKRKYDYRILYIKMQNLKLYSENKKG